MSSTEPSGREHESPTPPSEPDSVVSAAGLRVLLFTDTYAPHMNGVARTLARLVDTLRRRGGEVQVVTVGNGPSEAFIDRWPARSFWKYEELQVAAPSVRRARRLIERFAPTIVHVATPFGVGLSGRRAARTMGVPLVTSYHTHLAAYARHYGLGLIAGPGMRYLRWFHNGGRLTLCPTRAVVDELAEIGFSGTRVWGRGVDVERFDPRRRDESLRRRLGARADDVVIAYVGRLAPEKGLDRAFAAVRHARARLAGAGIRTVFALAGDGPAAAECRRMADADTHLLGRLEGLELARFFASADVLLFPSVTDTFGNVILEGMASGVAVVAADTTPAREVLGTDGATTARGVVAPPSADGLGAALAALAADRARREELSTRGRAHAVTQRWDDVFDGLLVSYSEALALP